MGTKENNWNSIKREDEWTELHWHLLVHTSALVLLLPPKIAAVMGKIDTLNSINPSKVPATSTTFIHHLLPCCTLWPSEQDLLGKKFLYLYKGRVYFGFPFFFFFHVVFWGRQYFRLLELCVDCGTCRDPAQTASGCAQTGSVQLGHQIPHKWDTTARCAAPMHLVNLVTHWTCCVSIDQLYSSRYDES